MAALAKTGSAGSYQPVALTPLYGTPPPTFHVPPCVFLGMGPKPKSKKDKARREPNVLHKCARKPWGQWSARERAELTFASNHQFWLVTEAWMADLRKDLLPVLPKNVERIGLKPFHVAVLAGHMEVAGVHRAQTRGAARRELPRVPRGGGKQRRRPSPRSSSPRWRVARTCGSWRAAEWFGGPRAWEKAAFVKSGA